VNYHYNTYNDNMAEVDYYDMLETVFTSLKSPFVVIHYPESIIKLAIRMGLFPEKIVSWVYNSYLPRQHRTIAYFGVKPDFTRVKQPYKDASRREVECAIANGYKRDGARLYDWWEVPYVKNISKEKTSHPCQIPLKVMKRTVGILPDGFTVVDPFMGSGTTGLACKELGIPFIGIEQDKDYFNIAKDRLSQELLFV
jgi:DNA modification methylase